MAAQRYRTFLTYSRQDKAAAGKLYGKLQSYRTPETLRGRDTAHGPAPASLHPIFRDQEENPASASLSNHAQSALMEATDLIVLCSPNAARSRWISQEIAYFQHLGKGARIHAALLEGEPEEALPPSLWRGAGRESLAADLRPIGDGWVDGPARLAAAALGVPYVEARAHETARTRRRSRIRGAVAAVFAALLVFAGVGAWRAVEATRVEEAGLTFREAAVLTAVELIGDAVEEVSDARQGDSPFADLADSVLTSAAPTADRLIAFAPDHDRLRAEGAWLRILVSRRYRAAGEEAKAESIAAQAMAIYAELPSDKLGPEGMRLRIAMLEKKGAALLEEGRREEAIDAFRRSIAVKQALAARAPREADWEKDLFVAQERIGDLLAEAGRGDEALVAFRKSLGHARAISERRPGDVAAARQLGRVLAKIGHAHLAASRGDEASAAFMEAFEIDQRLYANDPDDAERIRSLIFGHVQLAKMRPEAEAERYEAALGLARKLEASGVLTPDDGWMIPAFEERLVELREEAAAKARAEAEAKAESDADAAAEAAKETAQAPEPAAEN